MILGNEMRWQEDEDVSSVTRISFALYCASIYYPYNIYHKRIPFKEKFCWTYLKPNKMVGAKCDEV